MGSPEPYSGRQTALTPRTREYRSSCDMTASCYAAMIASGTWKPHWHRALAAEAQAAWAALRKQKGDLLWLRHVRGHHGHRWNSRADYMATLGQRGEERDFELPFMAD